MEGSKVMSRYDTKVAKKIYLYRNGTTNADPKLIVVNDRQIRDFSTFLTRVTSGLKAPAAVRNIYTPGGGHRVQALDDLRSGHYYVAGGGEHFKKVKYGAATRLLQRRPQRLEAIVPPRIHQAVVASARYKRPVEKPFIIHVFRNGDQRFRGVRILLPRRIMSSWEHVLQLVTDKAELFTPAKRLCTLDGRTVHAVSEIQDGGKYVVVEGSKPFMKVAYCATDSVHISPAHRKRHHTVPRPVAVRRRVKRQPASQPFNEPPTEPPQEAGHPPRPHPPAILPTQLLQRRKSRPMAGRKNKEARERAIEDHRADSIFGGSPTQMPDVRETRMPSPPSLATKSHQREDEELLSSQEFKESPEAPDTSAIPGRIAERKERVAPPIQDGGSPSSNGDELSSSKGVFHASGAGQQPPEQHTQTQELETSQGESLFKGNGHGPEDAEVVQESKDIEVERPLDLEAAETVEEEEEGEGEGERASQSDQAGREAEDLKLLESQPLQSSFDLSVNRVQQTEVSSPGTTVTDPPPAKDEEGEREGGSEEGGKDLPPTSGEEEDGERQKVDTREDKEDASKEEKEDASKEEGVDGSKDEKDDGSKEGGGEDTEATGGLPSSHEEGKANGSEDEPKVEEPMPQVVPEEPDQANTGQTSQGTVAEEPTQALVMEES